MHAISFLHAAWMKTEIFISAKVAEEVGVGAVGKNFVVLSSIHKLGEKQRMQESFMMQFAADSIRRFVKMIFVLADIAHIVK